MGELGLRHVGVLGDDAHHTTVAAGDHVRHEGLGGEHHAPGVDGEHPIPLFRAHLGQGEIGVDAGVVHQDVDLCEALQNAIARFAKGARIAHVGAHAEQALPAHKVPLRLVEPFLVDVEDGNPRASPQKQGRNRPTDTAGGAGHHGHLPLELLLHSILLRADPRRHASVM